MSDAREPPAEDAMQLGEFVVDRTLHLASGGLVRLKIEATLMMLNERDRRFAMSMLAMMNQYASDVGEDAFPPDL